MNSPAEIPGTLFIVSAPSGAGKTSLVNALLKQMSGIMVSISHTTRAMRPGEADGVHYHFVDKPQFQRMIEANEFLEHATVFDHCYGTSRQAVTRLLAAGTDVILEIDWQGARQVRTLFPRVTSIFILPPSKQALRERLTSRKQDSEAVISRRLRDAEIEMQHYPEFDYLLVNNVFETALGELEAIIRCQRLQTSRQAAVYRMLLDELLA